MNTPVKSVPASSTVMIIAVTFSVLISASYRRLPGEVAVEHRQQDRRRCAPIAAASVGEAQPSRIEPSTAKIMITGGTRLRAVIHSFCDEASGRPGSRGMRGPELRLHDAEDEDVDEVQARP